jgi:hypothetical protein
VTSRWLCFAELLLDLAYSGGLGHRGDQRAKYFPSSDLPHTCADESTTGPPRASAPSKGTSRELRSLASLLCCPGEWKPTRKELWLLPNTGAKIPQCPGSFTLRDHETPWCLVPRRAWTGDNRLCRRAFFLYKCLLGPKKNSPVYRARDLWLPKRSRLKSPVTNRYPMGDHLLWTFHDTIQLEQLKQKAQLIPG